MCYLSNGVNSNHPEYPLIEMSRWRQYLILNVSETLRDINIATMDRMLTETYTTDAILKGVISNDLE